MKIQQSPVEYHAGVTAVSGLILQPKYWLALAFFAILSLFVVGCGGSSGDGDPVFITDDGTIIGGGPGDPGDPSAPPGAATTPQLTLLGADVEGAQSPAQNLTPAEGDQAGSTTTLALVLDRPAPSALSVNYSMVGNAEAFTVNGAGSLDGQPLVIPSGARVLPFTIQAVGKLFDAAELQILSGEGYAVEDPEQATASFEITLNRVPLAALAPNSLDVPVGEFRNAAVILDPERPPAPLEGEGLRINYVLVGDPLVVQDDDDITERESGGPVDGTDPVAGIVEVNNAEPLTIAPGDFAVTFQVRRQELGVVTMILIGGDGYTVPIWSDPNAQLVMGAPGPLEFSGTGPSVVPFSVPSDRAVFFDLTHSGASNFIVWLRDGDANNISLLANEIGPFEGTFAENLSAGDYLLAIERADGDWTATIRF